MSENSQATQKVSAKEKINALTHKLFGSTPGDGEMQPKEGFSYSLCGFGQNLICTIIGSYLTVFMTDAIGFNALAVAFLMLGARIFDALNDPIMGSIVDRTRTKWGQMPSVYEVDGVPDCNHDGNLFLAVVSPKRRRFCRNLCYVRRLGHDIYGCRRSLLGTFHRNEQRHLSQRQFAYNRAFVLHGRRRYRHRHHSYHH